MTPKDMNSTVRAHLRKGELAVEHLEKLGWTFMSNVPSGPLVWKAPEEDALVKAVVDLIESRMVKPADPFEEPEAPLKPGDSFVITSLPMGSHSQLRNKLNETLGTVFKAREVEMHARYGLIVRFGFDTMNRGYWVPVSRTVKVPAYGHL